MRSVKHGTGLLDYRRWQLIRREALERDGWRCCRCGKSGVLQVDHIRPLHDDGEPYDLGNLQSLCVECHWSKTWTERGATPEQLAWRAYQRGIDSKAATR